MFAAASEISLVPTDSVLKTLDFFLVLADATPRLCYELTFKARFDKKQCLILLCSCEQIQIGVL